MIVLALYCFICFFMMIGLLSEKFEYNGVIIKPSTRNSMPTDATHIVWYNK